MAESSGDLLFGGIEAGGTKFVCGVGSRPDDFRAGGQATAYRRQFETKDGPDAVLPAIVRWFQEQEQRLGRKLAAIGIASFGPLDLGEGQSKTYGRITSTPKAAWRNVDLLQPFRTAFADHLPLALDTDVNGAALGEHRWGAARGVDDFLYVTVGTGLGAGAMSRGRLVHGLVHPEMGHLLLPRIEGDPFPGACERHGACWEGLCSGTAIKARVGHGAETLDAEHEAWAYTTRYMGYALANLVLTLSPRLVIIGGSVRKAGRLGEAAFFGRVRAEVQDALAGYLVTDSLAEGIDDYVVPPQLGDDAGLCGAIELARQKLRGETA